MLSYICIGGVSIQDFNNLATFKKINIIRYPQFSSSAIAVYSGVVWVLAGFGVWSSNSWVWVPPHGGVQPKAVLYNGLNFYQVTLDRIDFVYKNYQKHLVLYNKISNDNKFTFTTLDILLLPSSAPVDNFTWNWAELALLSLFPSTRPDPDDPTTRHFTAKLTL